MKEKVTQKENERKFYLSEFSYFDGEYDVTFNIIDVKRKPNRLCTHSALTTIMKF